MHRAASFSFYSAPSYSLFTYIRLNLFHGRHSPLSPMKNKILHRQLDPLCISSSPFLALWGSKG